MRFAWLFVALAACSTTFPPRPPPPDRDGLSTPLGAACAKLRELGCPEGQPTKQARTCYEHLTSLPPAVEVPSQCILAANTQDAVRACGDANTTRFRCAVP